MEENPQVEHPQSEPSPAQDKTIGIIAYLTVIGLVVAIVMNQEKKDPFGSFHIRQSLGIWASFLALSFVWIIPILGWIIGALGYILMVVLWIIGFINAIGGKTKTVPVLGDKYAEWFKGVS